MLLGRAGLGKCSLQRKKDNCVVNENPKIMKRLLFLLASCATTYQAQRFTGGYSNFLTVPDEASLSL